MLGPALLPKLLHASLGGGSALNYAAGEALRAAFFAQSPPRLPPRRTGTMRHKGYDWRQTRARVARRFDIVSETFTPMNSTFGGASTASGSARSGSAACAANELTDSAIFRLSRRCCARSLEARNTRRLVTQTIAFIDLQAQRRRIASEIECAVTAAVEGGQWIMGPQVRALEEQLAEYAGVKHCIACANGTDALMIVLRAWEIGPRRCRLRAGFHVCGVGGSGGAGRCHAGVCRCAGRHVQSRSA